jgi:two-component system nitrate/nitrite response regulator NarL
MANIIIIEPHPLLRLGLQQLMADVAHSVLGGDYAYLQQIQAERQPCDLLLLSVASFDDIQTLLAMAQGVVAPTAVLLLAEGSHLPTGVQRLPACVAGFLTKNASPDVMRAAVRLILVGGSCFPMQPEGQAQASAEPAPPLLPQWPLVDRRKPLPSPACQQSESALLGLTPRQYEVLVLLARGYPIKSISRYLNISVATAKAHTETLYQRLDVHNRNAAVYAAVSRGATMGWPSGAAATQGQVAV